MQFFLAFTLDETFQRTLEKLNPYLRSQFIGKEEYLLEVSYGGKQYLAKPISPYPTLDQLDNSEKHLISLLRRLDPQYAFSANPPILLSV